MRVLFWLVGVFLLVSIPIDSIMAGRLCSVQSLCRIVIVETVLMLSFWVGDYIPPFFNETKICDVTNSSIVRKLIQRNWSPILNHYGVSLPLECPLNLSRDQHGVRQSIKATRSSHWQCLKCGKKFYFERHLDLHIERRHNELINAGEDSVCLGRFCDIMRCDVLVSNSFLDEESKSTDVSIWTPSANTAIGQASKRKSQRPLNHPDSTLPKKNVLHISHSESNADNQYCDESYYLNLRSKCADLVWECLQGLISVLDSKDFKALQSELESVSCSYLSCSRYGDKCCSSKSKGKLRPFFIVFGSIFISLCLALAYYFTWIYTQAPSTPEDSETYPYETENSQNYDARSEAARQNVLLNRTTHL